MKDDIETTLDECIEKMRAGKSIDEVLKDYPEISDELRSLLEVSIGLEALPDASISLEGLMLTMSNKIDSQTKHASKGKPSRYTLFPIPVFLRVAASVVLVFALGFGTKVASADTVSGDLLYPVKRFVEKVRVILSLNERNEAELRISFSEERFSEAMDKYSEQGTIDDGLLRQMLEEAKLALEEASKLPTQEQMKLLSRVGYLTAHQQNVIETVKKRAPSSIQEALQPFADLCDQRVRWIGSVMKDAEMTSFSCPYCPIPGNVSEESNGASETKSSSRKRSMKEWMEMCP